MGGVKTFVVDRLDLDLEPDRVKAFAVEKYAQIKKTVSNPSFRVTALSAGSGAVTMGAGAGLMGLTAGAGVGAAVGVVPAIFTFGLSIPIGAFIGGACGLCTGAVVGGGAGLVGGGAAGFYGYEHRDEINGAAECVMKQTSTYANALKDRALSSKNFVISIVSGTGGIK